MTASTLTLDAFLLARIAEDESMARRMTEFACEVCGCDVVHACPGLMGDARVYSDPRRVLAECEAKRRIVELHDHGDAACWEMHRGTVPPGWKEEWDGRKPGDPWAHPSLEAVPERADSCETLRLLALPYADHPDFREEWRP